MISLDSLELHRSKRKTLSIEVQPNGKVVVRSPMKMPLYMIEAFVQERSNWIRSKVMAAATNISSLPPVLPMPPRATVIQTLTRMVEEELPKLGLQALRYHSTRVRKMKRRWGSCTGHGIVTLNEKLVLVPEHCARAVVVHELCHLVHMNHGQAFRSLTRDLMPDIDDADKELNRWSYILLS